MPRARNATGTRLAALPVGVFIADPISSQPALPERYPDIRKNGLNWDLRDSRYRSKIIGLWPHQMRQVP